MGYIFLGIAALNIIGVSGAALLMFAHGLSIAALFAMAGMLREKKSAAVPRHLRRRGQGRCPGSAFAFGLAAFASIGLPGFAQFRQRTDGLLRRLQAGCRPAAPNFQLAMVFALWGVVISAVYMLRAYRAIFLGEPASAVAAWSATRCRAAGR